MKCSTRNSASCLVRVLFGCSRDMTLVTYASNTSKTQKKLVFLLCPQFTISQWRLTMASEKLFFTMPRKMVSTHSIKYAVSSRATVWPKGGRYHFFNAPYYEHKPQKTLKRRLFQLAVAINMIEALAQRRLSNLDLPRKLRITIRSTFTNLMSETKGNTT